MTKTVDARRLSCPQPVMLTMEALANADEVVTIVDSLSASENVTRFGKSQGCEVRIEQKEEGTYLTLKKAKVESPNGGAWSAIGTVLFIGSDVVGRGEDRQLGSLLMQKFLHTVGGFAQKPERILLINNGVKLAAEDSLAVGELQQLEAQGVEILACGTCLAHFKLTDKVKAGKVSDMYTIADTMLKAGKVVSL